MSTETLTTENVGLQEPKIDSIVIRASYLAGWTDCPRRSAAKSLYKIIKNLGFQLRESVKNVSAAIGTGVHAGATHVMREKIEAREAKLTDAIEIGINEFRKESDGGIEFDSKTDSTNTAETQIKNIETAFYYGIAPEINPVDVERRYEAPVKAGFYITGQPDIIELGRLRDIKTGKDGQTYHAQLGGYSLLLKANGLPTPETLVVDWIPRVSTKKPQPEPVIYEFPTSVCEKEAQNVISSIQFQILNFQRNISEGIPERAPSAFPANLMSMLCSEKYCVAHGTDFCPVSKTIKKKEE